MRWLPILFTLVGCITSRIQSITSQAACSQSWSSIGPKTVDIYDNNYPVGIGAMSDLILRGSTLYVGAVNGGVWKTDNFREPTPTYKPLTDQQRCNGITALAAHPTNNQFVVAGCGSGSNAGVGGDWQGILITTDGGTTWKRAIMPNLGKTQLEVTSILVLSNNNILVATRLSRVRSSGGQYINQLDPEVSGIFRSTDSGTTFTKVRKGWTFTLKTDAAETEIYAVGSKALANDAWGNAVYVSKDQGATWSEYTNGLALGTSKDNNGCGLKNVVPSSARLAVSSNTTHQTMLLVIFTASKDQYCYDYYASTDHGVFWSVVGVSSEGKQFFPNVDVMGNQGITDLYLLADPANIGIFYLGGTDLARYRLSVQDLGDSYGVSQPILITFPRRPPEQIGNSTEKLNTHADARSAIWDPQQNAIIETNDGGIWALANPRDPEGSEWVWSRLPTDFATSEQNAVAYDPRTGIVVAAAQDNAVQISKTSVTSPNYDFFTTGPGDGVTAAVDRTVTPAVFHTGIQRLQLVISFPAGATLNARPGEFFFGYTKPFNYQPYGGDSEDSLFKDAVFDFTPKIKTNPYKSNQTMLCSVTPPQCALVYRRDRKPTVSDQITIINSGEKYGVWAQGGMKNGQSSATVYWAVGGTSVWTQDDARGSKVTRTLPWSGTATGIDTKDTFRVFAIAVDPRDYYTAYVTTSEQKLYRSTDFGSTWVVHPFPSQPWAVIVIPINTTTSAVLVGTQNGIYVAYDDVPWPWTWRLVGLGIPNVLVTEFDYDSGTDLLVVSTMGRGIWSFPALTIYLAASGNCPTPDQDYFVIATKEGTYTPPTSGSGDGKTSAASLKHPAFIWTGAMIFIVRWLMF